MTSDRELLVLRLLHARPGVGRGLIERATSDDIVKRAITAGLVTRLGPRRWGRYYLSWGGAGALARHEGNRAPAIVQERARA
jgi:hypothetical protein